MAPPSFPFIALPSPSSPPSLHDSSDSPHPLFPPASHQQSSLPEHHSALSVIDKLDRLWFWDNVFYLPCIPSCLPRSASSPSTSRDEPSKYSPFRSIELVQPLQPSSEAGGVSRSSIAEIQFPPARFAEIPRRRAENEDKEGAEQQFVLRKIRKQLADTHINVPKRQVAKRAMDGRTRSKESGDKISSEIERNVEGDALSLRLLNSSVSKEHYGIEKFKAPKLETISSSKQLSVCPKAVHLPEAQTRRRKRERRKSSRSMTDLEFDELKGIMDLGFCFTKDDLTPRIVNMFPGLRQQFGEDTADIERSSKVTPHKNRPFPSDAWLIRRPDSPLLNWRIPGPNKDGVDMKEQLKFWARAVAFSVRQES